MGEMAAEARNICESIVSRLDDLYALRERDIHGWIASSLMPVSDQSAHSYFITQTLLARLSTETTKGVQWGRVLNRIADELEATSSRAKEAPFLVRELRASFIAPSDLEVAEVVANASREGTMSNGNALKLHRAYKSSPPPSVALLQSQPLLDALLAVTFAPYHSKNLLDEKLWLMAYATSAIDGDTLETLTTEVDSTLEQLKSLNDLVTKITALAQMNDHMSAFQQATEIPITSLALLYWLEEFLDQPSFFEWGLSGEEVPTELDILDEIAITQPILRERLSKFWFKMLQRKNTGNPHRYYAHIKEHIADRLVLLSKVGHSNQVLERMWNNIEKVEEPIVVYFISKLLGAVDVPLEADFANLARQISSTFEHPIAIPK
ncbi:beta ketoadipyl CoA thiolase, th1 [Thoreauomyces humboldtii]|nr:beta ketoadipyl CoA thiolase, th1 [Thoreauomyces humboldtii]